jgi:hypothetical protein
MHCAKLEHTCNPYMGLKKVMGISSNTYRVLSRRNPKRDAVLPDLPPSDGTPVIESCKKEEERKINAEHHSHSCSPTSLHYWAPVSAVVA